MMMWRRRGAARARLHNAPPPPPQTGPNRPIRVVRPPRARCDKWPPIRLPPSLSRPLRPPVLLCSFQRSASGLEARSWRRKATNRTSLHGTSSRRTLAAPPPTPKAKQTIQWRHLSALVRGAGCQYNWRLQTNIRLIVWHGLAKT